MQLRHVSFARQLLYLGATFAALASPAHGTVLFASNYASLTDAIAGTGGTACTAHTLLITGTLAAGGTVVVPAGCELNFDAGGQITGTGPVTINGDVSAGRHQIFALSSGVVSFATNDRVDTLYPEWWGAVANDATDDSVAIAAAIAATPDATNGVPVARAHAVFIDGGMQIGASAAARDTAALTVEYKSVNLRFGNGEIRLYGTVRLKRIQGIEFAGAGQAYSNAGTRFNWLGNATDPAIRLSDVAWANFHDFYVKADTGFPLKTCIAIENISISSTNASQEDIFRNITCAGNVDELTDGLVTQAAIRECVGGTNAGTVCREAGDGTCTGGGTCHAVDCTGAATPWPCCTAAGEGAACDGLDENDDMHLFDHVTVLNYTGNAFWFSHSQSKANRVISCICDGTSSGAGAGACVSTEGGDGVLGGSFTSYGVEGHNHRQKCSYALSANDATVILGGNFEGDACLATIGTASSSTAMPVTIEGVRWAGDYISTVCATNGDADCRVITALLSGPLTLIGNMIGDASSQSAPLLFVYPNPLSTGRLPVTAIGNTIKTNLTNGACTAGSTPHACCTGAGTGHCTPFQRTAATTFELKGNTVKYSHGVGTPTPTIPQIVLPDEGGNNPITFADLRIDALGVSQWCSDCQIQPWPSPCASGGNGAYAHRVPNLPTGTPTPIWSCTN